MVDVADICTVFEPTSTRCDGGMGGVNKNTPRKALNEKHVFVENINEADINNFS